MLTLPSMRRAGPCSVGTTSMSSQTPTMFLGSMVDPTIAVREVAAATGFNCHRSPTCCPWSVPKIKSSEDSSPESLDDQGENLSGHLVDRVATNEVSRFSTHEFDDDLCAVGNDVGGAGLRESGEMVAGEANFSAPGPFDDTARTSTSAESSAAINSLFSGSFWPPAKDRVFCFRVPFTAIW